jgi:hypothetical protein
MNGPKHFILACALAVLPSVAAAQAPTGGAHDFDFEFGTWKAHLERLVKPLSGSDEWVELDGKSVVRKLWGGRGNLGELSVENESTRIEGVSLRLFNPATHQWSVYWANSRTGELGTPLVGGFHEGSGEFYSRDTWDGKPIDARFIISVLGPSSFRLEQAFSPDGRKTWETNWVATFVRSPES